MTFTLDAQVGAVLAAAFEQNGPPPAPPAGDVASRRLALDAMLRYFNNEAQPGRRRDRHLRPQRAHSGRGHAARAVVPAAVEGDHGGGAVPARRRDDPRLGADLRRAGLRYVARTGVPMLSLEYRLAPEHPHPTPVEDAYAGLAWLAGHAAELGVDPGRIAVMGDSAGGGLAAGVAILSRDRKGPAVARQLLIYPMLDDRTTVPDPHIAPFAGWSYDDNATGWDALLGAGTRTARSTRRPRRDGCGTRPSCRPPTSRLGSWTSSATRPSGTRSRSARPGCRRSCICTPACPTSTTPSPPVPTCRAARRATATACCAACDAPGRETPSRTIPVIALTPPRRPGTRRTPVSRGVQFGHCRGGPVSHRERFLPGRAEGPQREHG